MWRVNLTPMVLQLLHCGGSTTTGTAWPGTLLEIAVEPGGLGTRHLACWFVVVGFTWPGVCSRDWRGYMQIHLGSLTAMLVMWAVAIVKGTSMWEEVKECTHSTELCFIEDAQSMAWYMETFHSVASGTSLLALLKVFALAW